LDTGKAIGAVTRILQQNILNNFAVIEGFAKMDVTVGRPEPSSKAASTSLGPRLNLFLYELHFDQFLKNTSIKEDGPIPVWLVLKYLLTAFDDKGDSDSVQAHDLLGQGIQFLQSLDYLPIDLYASPLKDSPELLHITFNDSSVELLHSLMQGSDEKYRLSVCFEIRPVMIAKAEVPSSSLLVGIDYTKSPVEPIKEKGIHMPITSSFGPSIIPYITSISPLQFEIGSIVRLLGSGFDLESLTVFLGSIELSIKSKQATMIEFIVSSSFVNGKVISAGNQTIHIVQLLSTGKQISSNSIVGALLPTLTSISISLNRSDPSDLKSTVFGNVVITGSLLGTEDDEISVIFFRDGKRFKVFRKPSVMPSISSSIPLQTQLIVKIEESAAINPGKYQIVLFVNGQQAKNCPQVDFNL